MENELKKVVIPFDNCEEMYLSTASYPPRRLSLDGPLRFVTSHSRFALVSMRNHAGNKAPEEGVAVLEHMSEVSSECIPPKQPYRFPSLKRTEALFASNLREERIMWITSLCSNKTSWKYQRMFISYYEKNVNHWLFVSTHAHYWVLISLVTLSRFA